MNKSFYSYAFIICAGALLLPALLGAQVKWEETFDSSEPPPGWFVFNNDGSPIGGEVAGALDYVTGVDFFDDNGQIVAQVEAESGTNFWFSTFENANSSGVLDEWLVGPRIQNIETGDFLSFYAGAPDEGFDDSLRVFVSTTDSSLGAFVNQIDHFKVDGPISNWNEYTFDLSAFAGSDIFVAVNYYLRDSGPSGLQGDAVWIDHFKVTANVTSVAQNPAQLYTFQLLQNFPNPFNPTTTISFELPEQSDVTLRVHNLLGQTVATLYERKPLEAGEHRVTFDATRLPNGVYYYRIDSGRFRDIKKMTLIK